MACLHENMTIQVPSQKVLAVAFNADGTLCAAGDRDGIIHIVDVQSGSIVKKLKQHLEFVYCLVFDAQTGHLLSAGKDKSIREWDLESCKMVRDFAGIFSISSDHSTPHGLKPATRSHRMTILSLALGPDHKMATGSQDTNVKFWQNGDPVRTYDWHSGPVTCVRFQPETAVLFSASRDKTIRSWNDNNGAVLHRYNGHLGEIIGLEFIDESHFVSVDELGYVIGWKVQDESPSAFLYHSECRIGCAAYKDGYLVLGRTDGRLEIINVQPDKWPETSECVCISEPSENVSSEIRSLAIKDMQCIASGDNSGKLRFWKLDV